VDQVDAEALADQLQQLAAVAGAVVQVQGLGGGVAQQGAAEDLEHVPLPLQVAGHQRRAVAAGVVEQAVDQHAARAALAVELGQVADVTVPQVAGVLGLPAAALHVLFAAGPALRDAGQPGAAVQPPQGRLAELTLGHDAVAHRLGQHQLGGRRRVFHAHLQQQVALRVIELAGKAPGPGPGQQAAGQVRLGGVVPPLQGLEVKGPGALGPWRPVAFLCALLELLLELSWLEFSAQQVADDAEPEQGNPLPPRWFRGLHGSPP